MSSDPPTERRPDLTESSMTVPSDSENYSSSNNELSPSPPSSSSSPLILYTPPTFWGLLRGAAINLLLPFVNGLMLGLGELLAHEAAFRLGWSGTKVRETSFCMVSLSLKRWQWVSMSDVDIYLDLKLLTNGPQMQIFPTGRNSRPVGPGVGMREVPSVRRRRGEELDELTSME
ncbi:MAG: hypothetical protein L6R39_006490 [Caloplaca ligustica]|nr:MAG: hypothetical protein L6R39_006490 [Caloplaca ligustica]